MIINVTGCHDCPFYTFSPDDGERANGSGCFLERETIERVDPDDVDAAVMEETFPPDCPLAEGRLITVAAKDAEIELGDPILAAAWLEGMISVSTKRGCENVDTFLAQKAARIVRREIPAVPRRYAEAMYHCPRCDNAVARAWEKGYEYCARCGQALDWR